MKNDMAQSTSYSVLWDSIISVVIGVVLAFAVQIIWQKIDRHQKTRKQSRILASYEILSIQKQSELIVKNEKPLIDEYAKEY